MLFDELVLKRRSCRKFADKKVLQDDVEKIIETTLLAPSWKNSETGRYYLAISDEAINEVYESLPDFNKSSSKNSAYLVVTYKKGISGTINNEYSPESDLWSSYDLGLQSSYLCLKASDLGYDTLIMGLRDEDRLRKYFNISDDEVMLPVIALGYRDGDCKLNPRKQLSEVLKIK